MTNQENMDVIPDDAAEELELQSDAEDSGMVPKLELNNFQEVAQPSAEIADEVIDAELVEEDDGIEESTAVSADDIPGLDSTAELVEQPGKFNRFLKGLLRWTVVVLIVFVAGLLTMWLVRVRSLQVELGASQTEVIGLLAERDTLQAQVQDLDNQVSGLENTRDELQSDLDDSEFANQVLYALVDVTSAQAALLRKDIVTARAALSGTAERLQALVAGSDAEDQQTITSMLTRLDLILEEIESDSFAALNDLEVLYTNLTALERSAFQD